MQILHLFLKDFYPRNSEKLKREACYYRRIKTSKRRGVDGNNVPEMVADHSTANRS